MKVLVSSVLLVLCLCNVRTSSAQSPSNSWDLLKQRLHEKVLEIFDSEKSIKVAVGKFFKYSLNAEDGARYEEKGTSQGVEVKNQVFERSSKKLPTWLTFNPSTNTLHGFPTDEDLRESITLVIRKRDENAKDGFVDGAEFLQLRGKRKQSPFNCKSEDTTVASIIFHTDIKNFDGEYRLHFLRNFAHVMELSIHDLHLFDGDRMASGLNAEDMRKAGPGDPVTGKQPGFTVSWKVTCGRDYAGNLQLYKLSQFSENGGFHSHFHQPVLGWFVTSTTNNRLRRALAPGSTPVIGGGGTPGVGTPTISASPSVTVMSTGMIKPTPTKSSTSVRMTSTPATPPPDTTTTMAPTTTTVTTEEPSTTPDKVTSTTEGTSKATTKKTMEPPTGIPTNKDPVLKKSLGTINIIAGQALQKELPLDMFEDADGDSLTISFEYYPNGMNNAKEMVPANHWMVYNQRQLYLLPPKNLIKRNDTFAEVYYVLTATDPSGGNAIDTFNVRVNQDPEIYNNMFNMTLDLDYKAYSKDVIKRVTLVQTLARAMKVELNYDIEYTQMRALGFSPGSVILQWSVAPSAGDDLDLKGCNSALAETYVQDLSSQVYKEFLAVNHNIIVSDVGIFTGAECLIIPATSSSDSGLWERILIPVIVIVVILLIIALILCCVYRRKKKYEPANEADTGEYFGKQSGKKPVIFLEEYEEKQDFVSLQPLILPNEKPPVQAYEPRADTPDGPSSGSGSTDNEEKELLGSPKAERSFINAPPPYSSNN